MTDAVKPESEEEGGGGYAPGQFICFADAVVERVSGITDMVGMQVDLSQLILPPVYRPKISGHVECYGPDGNLKWSDTITGEFE